MTNIIDIKKLPVKEGKTSDTYLTLSQEGDLTRTTIVSPEGSEKYAGKGFIRDKNNISNFGYEDSAIVAYAVSHLEKEIVAKAWDENKALFVNLGSDVKKQIPVSIEAHYNADAKVTGYTVWGWYSKTQTITWEFDETVNSVLGNIE